MLITAKFEGTKLANMLEGAKSNSWPFPDLKEYQCIHLTAIHGFPGTLEEKPKCSVAPFE